jgi:hypothetical protein
VCTLSWTPLPGGYALAMNRDERPTRARGLPPVRSVVRDVPVLMPTDPDAGGTWVSVNGIGLSLALLNRYGESPRDPGATFTSRGLLIREMACFGNPSEVESDLKRRPLERYRPFTLVVMARGGRPQVFDWNGLRLAGSLVRRPGLVRASSGSDQAEAERVRGGLVRTAAAEQGGLTAATLERLHRSHFPEKGAISICMHRQEANTVSLSLITVNENDISIFYVDGPPGENAGGLLLQL